MNKRIDGEVIYQIVEELTGKITPVGLHDIDTERLVNLKSRIEILDKLISDLVALIEYKDVYSVSISDIGETSFNNLERIKEFFRRGFRRGYRVR